MRPCRPTLRFRRLVVRAGGPWGRDANAGSCDCSFSRSSSRWWPPRASRWYDVCMRLRPLPEPRRTHPRSVRTRRLAARANPLSRQRLRVALRRPPTRPPSPPSRHASRRSSEATASPVAARPCASTTCRRHTWSTHATRTRASGRLRTRSSSPRRPRLPGGEAPIASRPTSTPTGQSTPTASITASSTSRATATRACRPSPIRTTFCT